MNIFFSFFVFCIVLFLYLHIYHHLKTSNDLEVYEIEKPSKDKLEEISDIRQPVIFNYNNEQILQKAQLSQVVDDYGAFDIKIRNVKDNDENSELYLPLIFRDTMELFRNDTKSTYISEQNEDFLEETGLLKIFKHNDGFLRPPMVSSCEYDYMLGSKDACTPLRYDLNYRNYYLVTSGTITIKMLTPESSRYLYTTKDYDNFEFSSVINPWNVQDEYKADFDKVKTLEVTLNVGDIIYIPAYWWYSIKYNKISSICCFKYRTYMNTISILPQIIICFLQRLNIQRKITNIRESIITDSNDS